MKKLALASVLFAVALTGYNCGTKQKSSLDKLTSPEQKTSYAIGQDMGAYLKNTGMKVDIAALTRGIEDTLQGRKPLMTPEEQMQVRQAFMQKQQQEQMAKAQETAGPNKKAGEEFLAKNKTQKGVITTASGLQYIMLKEGKGPAPRPPTR